MLAGYSIASTRTSRLTSMKLVKLTAPTVIEFRIKLREGTPALDQERARHARQRW
jgi:hypothetical protein